jgi:transcription antitermination factor NusG
MYCPTTTVIKQWSDRKKKVQEPVFTSYIFAKVNETQRQDILKDPSIVSSVFWLKRPVIIRDNEIQAIKHFLEDFSEAKISTRDISKGDRAVINSGPFRGEEGIVREKRGNKALLHLYSLGTELHAEIALAKLDTIK